MPPIRFTGICGNSPTALLGPLGLTEQISTAHVEPLHLSKEAFPALGTIGTLLGPLPTRHFGRVLHSNNINRPLLELKVRPEGPYGKLVSSDKSPALIDYPKT